jgi:hypothetical protein
MYSHLEHVNLNLVSEILIHIITLIIMYNITLLLAIRID